MEKSNIRKKYLQIRDNFSPDYVKIASNKISKTLFSLEDYKNCKNIFVFLSMKNEVSTEEIIKNSLSLNKNVFVPILTDIKGKMLFSQIYKDTKFSKNTFNTLEPKTHKNILKNSDENTIIIVPGIIYSMKKFRVGYGGGYYDRFLKNNKSLANIGVCFEELILKDFKTENFDEKVDYIITEKNIIY